MTTGALAAMALPAMAFWTVPGGGSATARAGALSAPTGAVTAATTSDVTISFTAGDAALTTQLAYSASDGHGNGCDTAPGATSCTVTGLGDGQQYTFTAVARLVDWTSPASPPFTATTARSPRGFVVDPGSITTTTGTRVTLSLQATKAGAAESDYAGTATLAWAGPFTTGSALPSTVTLAGGRASIDVTFATAGAGAVTVSDGTRSTTVPVDVSSTVPTDRTAPTVVLTQPSSDVVRSVGVAQAVAATGSDDASGVSVQLQVSKDGGPWTALGPAVAATGTGAASAESSWSASTAGTYAFRAVATDGAGNTAVSGQRTVTVPSTAPSNVRVTCKPSKLQGVVTAQITLTWTAAAGTTGHVVYRGTANPPTTQVTTTSNGVSTASFTLPAGDGVRHWFAVASAQDPSVKQLADRTATLSPDKSEGTCTLS